MSPSHDERLHAFDGLRAFAMLAVVLAHSLLSFMDTPIGWAIRDTSTWLGADFVVWCIRAFVLPLFFLLSGTFAHFVIERDGFAAFTKRRTVRLLGPLAIFLVPVSWAMNSMWDWGRELASLSGAGRAQVAQAVPHLEASELPVTLAHLWFLYYLLIVSLVLGAALWGARRFVTARHEHRRGSVWWPLVLIVVLAVVLWWAGKLQLDTPLGFVPNVAVLVFHAAFFAWGWFMHPHAAKALREYGERVVLFGLLALGCLGLALPDLIAGTDGTSSPSLLGLLGSAGFSVALTAVVLGLGARFVTRANQAVRVLSDGAYWCYIVHLPVVVLLQIAMSQVDFLGPVELVIVFGGAMAVSLGSYWFGVRGRWLGRLVG
jgi:peptidoglycan/LPS O-acetylase OafA/YrhL